MTVGKLQTKQELDMAYDEVKDLKVSFETKIHKVSVEIIGEDEVSIHNSNLQQFLFAVHVCSSTE